MEKPTRFKHRLRTSRSRCTNYFSSITPSIIFYKVRSWLLYPQGDHWDFVDYTNFHDDNIPGGWNDSWSGEFKLLPSQWYNASDYYVRGNFTYEAPMIATAWLPLLGNI